MILIDFIKRLLPTKTIYVSETVEIERKPGFTVEKKKQFVNLTKSKQFQIFWEYIAYKIDFFTREAMQCEDDSETHDWKTRCRAMGKIILDNENYKRDIAQSERPAGISVPEKKKRKRLFELPEGINVKEE